MLCKSCWLKLKQERRIVRFQLLNSSRSRSTSSSKKILKQLTEAQERNRLKYLFPAAWLPGVCEGTPLRVQQFEVNGSLQVCTRFIRANRDQLSRMHERIRRNIASLYRVRAVERERAHTGCNSVCLLSAAELAPYASHELLNVI